MPKKNLVLLPGMLCDNKLWEYQIAQLSNEATVFIGDLTKDKTIESMATSILKRVSGPIAVAGFSMGGIVATEIARQAPERVEKLALIGTNPFPLLENQIAWWDRFVEKVENVGFLKMIYERLLPAFLHQDFLKDEKLINKVLLMASNVGKDAMFRQISAIQRGLSIPNKEIFLQLSCPTIVVAGREDALCPISVQERIMDYIPFAELSILEQCGHLSPLEQPEAVTALLQSWLRK